MVICFLRNYQKWNIALTIGGKLVLLKTDAPVAIPASAKSTFDYRYNGIMTKFSAENAASEPATTRADARDATKAPLGKGRGVGALHPPSFLSTCLLLKYLTIQK